MKRLIKRIEELGWTINQEDGTVYELGKYSPAGHDFWISVDSEGSAEWFIENLFEVYCDFDVSYETYLWLDSNGHGKKGAPYDMRDLYDDMEASQNNILALYNELNLIDLDDEEEDADL